ncbi:ABC transporter permease [Mucilaginibacter ginsenosidivorans]|uniref:FtsX-like permease family protein n=1 Tax=Mucilaginibacter ginsenosidivorans TaxID=398053 RepID=A0A5B8UYT1_9SPHI|nr:ABC transporter permease [Mucilaginibacter ginsenosidivorans]QEC64162.1 FtsX-like permease family protein [Mucilaginibacter ginsenosidivorans]
MLKINFKLAFRNMFRNKLYTTINIIGLGVASAFCILVYLYVKNERSFDRFHHDQAQLFRLEESDLFASLQHEQPKKSFFSFMMKDAEQKNMVVTPPILAEDLKRNFPEVESAIRLGGLGDEIVRAGNQSFKEKDNVTYADADFFKVFNFPLISGNPATVLSEQNKVVISERLAKKYFGNENAVGKVISFPNDNNMLFTVGGVSENFPANSSLQYDMVIPIQADPDYKERLKNGTNSFSHPLILKLKAGTDVAKFNAKLNVFAKTYFKSVVESMQKNNPNKVEDMHLYLRPFADAHYNQSGPWGHYTDLKNIYQLTCLTFVILFIACLNYILLTLTSTMSRSQDVGVRKTIGAGRLQIILQYYAETQLLAFISVLVGLVIASACLPFFSSITGSQLQLAYFSFGQIALLLFVLAVSLGLIAGIYPALAMSGLKPLNIMRSFSAYKLNPVLSKGLVVVQFTICVILIISSLVINKQMHFINKTDMGFDKDQVVVLGSPYSWSDKEKLNVLEQRMYNYAATQPAIQDITSASFVFAGYNSNGYIINGQKTMLQELNVDFNYFSFMKIPIVKGRAFSRAIPSDSAKIVLPPNPDLKGSTARHAVVVNETLYGMLGKPELGVLNNQMGGIIIGVCKDYHVDDLTKKIQPAYHTVNKNIAGQIWIKISAGKNIAQTLQDIKTYWDKVTDNSPFEYTFMDQEVAKSYDAYMRWMATITTSCILAIILACLGLFGLSGITTINRTKEIGIRKVLGASISNLFLLLNKGTIMLAIGSFIIAVPIALYLVYQWLDNFVYRIKPDWLLFSIAGAIAMLTAILAVSYHTIRAALANPVKSLRSE